MTAPTFPTGRAFMEDLARALHNGRTWREIADALGADTVRDVRDFYRPKVRSYILRRLSDHPPHGTLARYQHGSCYPDGRRCDPCMCVKNDLQRQRRAEQAGHVALPTSPAALDRVAAAIDGAATWDDLAAEAGRTIRFYRDTYRPLVQTRCLTLINARQPTVGGRAHGTNVKYVQDRCRCEPCTYAGLLYERRRRAKKRRGLEPYADAVKAREHVRWLMAHNVGLKTIAVASGVAHGTLVKLIYGVPTDGRPPSTRIRAATGRRLLAVTLKDRADGALVDATDTHACVALLVEAGWTKVAIARAIGQRGPGLQIGAERVTVRNARAIRDLWRSHALEQRGVAA